jgi:lauroyl/myristoyl acyltransferase
MPTKDSKADPMQSAPATPQVTGKDIAVLFGLPVLFAFAWFVPQGLWPKLCAAMAGAYTRFTSAGRREELDQPIRGLVGERPLARPPGEIPAAVAVADLRMLLAQLRLYRPFAAGPRIELEGGVHLDEAAAHGKGTVLWIGNFVAGGLFAKMALRQAGHRVTHLSHPKHGFSDSRFGMKFLNPVRTHLEARHLDNRVVMNPANPIIAMLELHKRLANNGIVSITVRDYANRPNDLPFLDGRHRLAPGAPEIAQLTGARLLPVFAMEDGPDNVHVRIEPPIDIPADQPREAAVEAAMQAYLQRLEPYVLKYPDQWLGWPFTSDHAR